MGKSLGPKLRSFWMTFKSKFWPEWTTAWSPLKTLVSYLQETRQIMRSSWILLARYLPFVLVSTSPSATPRRGQTPENVGRCQRISSSPRSPAMQDGNSGCLVCQIIAWKGPMAHSGRSQSALFAILTPISYQKKVQSASKVNWKPVFFIMENAIVSGDLPPTEMTLQEVDYWFEAGTDELKFCANYIFNKSKCERWGWPPGPTMSCLLWSKKMDLRRTRWLSLTRKTEIVSVIGALVSPRKGRGPPEKSPYTRVDVCKLLLCPPPEKLLPNQMLLLSLVQEEIWIDHTQLKGATHLVVSQRTILSHRPGTIAIQVMNVWWHCLSIMSS